MDLRKVYLVLSVFHDEHAAPQQNIKGLLSLFTHRLSSCFPQYNIRDSHTDRPPLLKKMISPESARDIWRKLFSIASRLRTTSFGVLDRDFDCSFAQFPIVQFFFTYPNAAPAMKDLMSYVGLSSGAVSQAVDALVEASILERVPSEKDRRSTMIRATAELLAVRNKAIDYFQGMLDAFQSGGHVTPEEIASADGIFVRLAESRTGGENAVIRNYTDLSVPGLLKHDLIDREHLQKLPIWILTLHFVTCLKLPTILYCYRTPGRMTRGKIRFLDYLFLLSEKEENPTVKDLATRFRISSGVALQTLNALIHDGVLERDLSQTDRQTIRVHLTLEGLRIRRLTAASYTKFMQNFFSAVEPERAEMFNRTLDRFLEFLDKEGKTFLLPESAPVSFN